MQDRRDPTYALEPLWLQHEAVPGGKGGGSSESPGDWGQGQQRDGVRWGGVGSGGMGGAATLLVCVEGGAERLWVWAEGVAWERGC